MALAPIAPWVVPPDYMGAIKSGASVGTELRGQDIQAGEAADRLRLAYDQLSSEEQARSQEANAKMALAKQGMDLRAAQQGIMERYRAGLLSNQQQRMSDLLDYREKSLAQKEDLAKAANELRSRNIHFGTNGEVLKLHDDGTVEELRPARAAPEKQPTASFPLDPANPFGPKITGSLGSPEIAARYSAATNAPPTVAGAPPSNFSLLHPSTWFGGGAAPAAGSPGPAPAPAAGFRSPAQVKEAVASGKLSREDGVKVLREQFGYE